VSQDCKPLEVGGVGLKEDLGTAEGVILASGDDGLGLSFGLFGGSSCFLDLAECRIPTSPAL